MILSHSLKRSTFPYEQLEIAEQKQSELWVNVPKRWTGFVTGERTQNTNWAQKEAHGER